MENGKATDFKKILINLASNKNKESFIIYEFHNI